MWLICNTLASFFSALLALSVAGTAQVSKPSIEEPLSFMFGRYYQGDGLGMNNTLFVRKDRTFSFDSSTDMGAEGHNYGTWTFSEDVLILHPQLANGAKKIWPVMTHLVPVHTGNRVFLVELNAMPGFAAAIAATDMSEMGLWSPTYKQVRLDRYDVLEVPGETPLPSKYMDYFKNGPVKAIVEALRNDGTVQLSTKTPARVKVGMLFTNVEWFSNVDIQITKIESGVVLAKVLYRRGATTKVKIGDRFFTGEYYVTPGDFDEPSFAEPPVSHQ